ncbi:hypothetical protein V2J09_005922 [Rumex salicifolius]
MRVPLTVNRSVLPSLSSNHLTEKWSRPTIRNPVHHSRRTQLSTRCFMGTTVPQTLKTFIQHKNSKAFEIHALSGPNNSIDIPDSSISDIFNISELRHSLLLADIDPATAKLAIAFIGPFLSAFSFLFIIRIVMSWYPKLPVSKFPYVLAYAPTEPILIPTRKVIPPLGGVDVTPVVWFGLLSFLNEILVGPQGLLVLISQQR